MRQLGIGLVAALLLVALAPVAVMSASKKAPAIDAKARSAGMAQAPAAVQQMGLNCQVADARFVGKAEDKKAKTSTTYYEVDCAEGPGFLVSVVTGGASSAFTCVEANTEVNGRAPTTACILPGNADPKADLGPALTKANVQCTPSGARGIGQSKTNTYLEVACQEGTGFIVITSAPFDINKPVEAQNCLSYDDVSGNITCTLTTKAQRMGVIDRYVAEAKNNCAIKDRRFVGSTKDSANFFETSCADGKGYIYKIDSAGRLAQTWDCAKALGILGGCILTDSREATNEQAGLYTRLAKKAGSNCEVEKYAIFPAAPGKEAVELVCKDGSGGVGLFDTAGNGVVYDCGRALVAGYRCGLNKPESANAALTADLRKYDVKTCTVSESRLASKTTKGTILLEVACTDGLKGYMIEYRDTPTVTAVGATNCSFISGCKLKGNT